MEHRMEAATDRLPSVFGVCGAHKLQLDRLYSCLDQSGITRDEIYRECGKRLISDSVGGMNSEVWNLYVILDTVERIAPRGFGFRLGEQTHLSEYGNYYKRLSGCATMWETRRAVRHFHDATMQPNFYQDWIEGGEWHIMFGLPLAPCRGSTVLFEELLAKTKYECEHFLGQEIPIKRIEVPYPAPSHRAHYEDLLSCRVLFQKSALKVVFDEDVLRMPSAVQPVPPKISSNEFAEEPSEELTVGDRVTIAILEQLVLNPGTYPSLMQVADGFGRSTSTIKRWLNEEELNYRELVNLVRHKHVSEYLTFTDFVPKEIAHRLGFTNVHNFRRAFRRWTNMMPGEYRDLMLSQAPVSSIH